MEAFGGFGLGESALPTPAVAAAVAVAAVAVAVAVVFGGVAVLRAPSPCCALLIATRGAAVFKGAEEEAKEEERVCYCPTEKMATQRMASKAQESDREGREKEVREREGRERDKGEKGEKGEKVLNEHTTTTTNKTAIGENVVATTCKSILSCDVRFWQWYPQKIGQKETTPIRDSNAWVPDHSTRFRVVEKQRSSFAKHPHKSLALVPLLDFFFSIFSFFFCFFFLFCLSSHTHTRTTLL